MNFNSAGGLYAQRKAGVFRRVAHRKFFEIFIVPQLRVLHPFRAFCGKGGIPRTSAARFPHHHKPPHQLIAENNLPFVHTGKEDEQRRGEMP
jgi:hypothetical protein